MTKMEWHSTTCSYDEIMIMLWLYENSERNGKRRSSGRFSCQTCQTCQSQPDTPDGLTFAEVRCCHLLVVGGDVATGVIGGGGDVAALWQPAVCIWPGG
jgi:hypothetical protein